MSRWRSERGAAAVEFALVLPILLMIMLAIIEFGRAYNVQISLTHAARETVRYMAIHDDWDGAKSRGLGAAPSVDLQESDFVASFAPGTTSCLPNNDVRVTVTYDLETITGVGGDLTLTGKAAMRCGG